MANEPIVVARCPLCGKPRELKYRPFCSKHCADLDLGRWFNGLYAMPAREDEEQDSFDVDIPSGAGKSQDLS